MYFSSMPSVECWYVLSLVVRRYISFYLQWDVGSSPSVERWCVLLSSSSVVRRYISPSTSSGTLVVHLQWDVGVFCYLHRQWYVDVYLLIPSVGRWYIVSAVVRRCISLQYLQWDVGMCYRQWYVDELSLFISSVVRWYISLKPSVGRWYMLSSVVRRCISL